MLITTVVVDEIVVTQRAATPTLHLAAEPRRKWLSVYIVHNSERPPPSLNITRANILKCRCSSTNGRLATIKLEFPNVGSMTNIGIFVSKRILLTFSIALETFREELETCLRDSVTSAREARKHRDFQRNPIIKTTSTLRRKPALEPARSP